jgi:hypothetical protein
MTASGDSRSALRQSPGKLAYSHGSDATRTGLGAKCATDMRQGGTGIPYKILCCALLHARDR